MHNFIMETQIKSYKNSISLASKDTQNPVITQEEIDDAIEEFDGDYDDEELRLYRIKFISEVAN